MSSRDSKSSQNVLPASRIYIVIPAFNEADALAEVLIPLRERYAHIVVIDDGSTDQTAATARRCGADVLRHPLNRGQGAALQTGITFALRAGAEIIVTFDADGQHQVEDIESLIRPIQTGACGGNTADRKRSRTTNPAAFDAVERKPATGVGAPS